MNLQELIFESESLISKIENKEKSIPLVELSKLLDIKPVKLLELFENENIYIGKETDINIELLKQILLKEPEISSSPKKLAKLLLSSNKLLKKIYEKEFIRLNVLCRNFDMGVGYITAQKNTYSPLIVNARARNIPENCGVPSSWSNGISRYYGTVSSNRSTSNVNNSNYDSELPLKEHFLNSESKVYVETLNLYEWLNYKYSNKDLSKKEVDKIINILRNEKYFENLNIQIFNFYGIKVFDKNYKQGKHVINLSNFRNGIYFVKYKYGNTLSTKTIIKN